MRAAFTICLALAAGLTGCVDPRVQPPSVTYQGATLVQSPSQEMLAAYYCPQVVPGAALLCLPFGAPPPASAMVVAFDLALRVQNPNHFPIPVAEALTAVTLFPGEGSQALGASCVVFCSPDDPTCTGQPGPDSCTSRSGDIRSITDFAGASADLLFASGVSLAQGQAPSFRMPQIAQDGDAVIEARFAFGPGPLLTTLQNLGSQAVNQLLGGAVPTFTIPYRIEGTIWLDVGSLGRVAVPFGPVDGTWTIPTTALVPGP